MRGSRLNFASLLAAIAVLISLVACGDDVPQCDELAETCDDATTQLGVECHELGHDGDAAECEARYDECLTECSQ